MWEARHPEVAARREPNVQKEGSMATIMQEKKASKTADDQLEPK